MLKKASVSVTRYALVSISLIGCAGPSQEPIGEKVGIGYENIRWLKGDQGKQLIVTADVKEYLPGSEIRIKVLSDGKPVWSNTFEEGFGNSKGVLVTFDEKTRETSRGGWVSFVAPESKYPLNYYVTARKSGYGHYNVHSIDGVIKYSPDTLNVTVFPSPGVVYSLPPQVKKHLKKIRIHDTTWLSDIDRSALNKKLKEAGLAEIDYTGGEDEEDILDDLADADEGDIWIFHGHSGDTSGDGTPDAVGDDDDNAITADELCRALNRDQDPPSVIILSGCATSEIARKLCDCGARIVVGYSTRCFSGNAAKAAETFLEDLLDGKTFDASRMNASSLIQGLGGSGEVTVCEGGSLGSVDLSIAKLGDVLHTKKPSVTEVSSFIMQPNQNNSAFETLIKATLTDKDGNPLPGRLIIFYTRCTVGVQSSAFYHSFKSATTDAAGIATNELLQIANPKKKLYCKVEVSFGGDEEYEASEDSDYETVN